MAGMPAQSGREGGWRLQPILPFPILQHVGLFNGEAMDHNINDHEVWMRCFTAAIAAVLGAREAADDSDLEAIVKYCGRIADEALDEERARRPEPPRFGYQTLKPDVIR